MIQERFLRNPGVTLFGWPDEQHEANRPFAEACMRSIAVAARLDITALADRMPDFTLVDSDWDSLCRIPFPQTIFEYYVWNYGKKIEAAMVLVQVEDDEISGALLSHFPEASPNIPATAILARIAVKNSGYELILPPQAKDRGINADWLDEQFVGPWAFAMVMLSCKNVTTERVLPTRQERRRYERDGKQPPNIYRIVVSLPGKQSHTIAGPRRLGEPVMPAHMVRGHFAEYTEDAPRFGRQSDGVGRFWIPAHVRGKREEGQDVEPKEYSIRLR